MLPDGWQESILDSVSQIVDCKHRTPKYVEKGVPLISPGTIKWGAIDLVSPTKHVSQEEYISLMDHCEVEIGDLVMGRNQSVGIASYVDRINPFVLGQDTILIKPSDTDSLFLFYSLQSTDVQRKIFKLAGGSTFSRINLGDIRKLKITFPSQKEQKKIAKILSMWDKAISSTEQLIVNSQQLKKALMQQLLTGKKRLVGFNGEWEDVAIKQFGVTSSGGTPSTKVSSYWGGNIHWMTPTDVTALKSRFITNTKRKITFEGVNNSSATILPAGSLLVCTRATIGLMSISTGEITTNQGFKNIVPNQNYDVDFLYYLFNYFKNELIRYACGSTFLELSKKDFERIVLLVPLLKEQQKIAQILSSADQEIETLQQKLNFLKEEKKALMQQLLTGKRRVKV